MNKPKSNKHELVRLGTIIGSFVLGWAITIGGFIVPPLGVIDNSILIVLGQAMTYSAAGLGMKDYVKVQISKQMNTMVQEPENYQE